ncbi:acyl carrier protein [Aquabacterium sp. OR-4]|uniref:acyl carrier protein n=1 Tax=Aquabacterium sp. OR-4 TaxID=2978127 RepID=UPI0021B499B1|nr:acyl carrier protein [Aquabacterium sp. OR-4]MDT7837643.1 acyl carrier protein [Aquabacterium sp. OR-4]
MNLQANVLSVLDEALALDGRTSGFDGNTPLLGALPELDSMAIVTVISALESRFGIMFDDDEISGETFATVDSLTNLIASKLDA